MKDYILIKIDVNVKVKDNITGAHNFIQLHII